MHYFTFHNVEISVRANNSVDAYTYLCEKLDSLKGEWSTDTFTNEETMETQPTSVIYMNYPVK